MKMSYKCKKRIQGSISVLLIIILVPTMVLSALIVDTARINMAKSMVSSAGDLALSSAIANYDTILKDVYGLFSRSQGKSEAELAADIKGYFEETLVSYGVTNKADAGQYVDQLMGDFNQLVSGAKNGDISNFMAMEIPENSFSISGVPASSLNNSSILRTQIIEYMKYRAPVEFGLSFLDTISAFKNIQEQTKVVEEKVKAQEKTQDVTSNCKNLITLIREYDTMIDGMQDDSGASTTAVLGENAYDDGVVIEVFEYPKQFPKYKNTWDPNYELVNKLALVFWGNPVDISSVYLVNQGYGVPGVDSYVRTGSDGLLYDVRTDKTGISGVSISSDSTTGGRSNQLTAQINLLKGDSAKGIASSYVNANFLPHSNLTADYGNIADGCETSAMEAFITYEKFLTNAADSPVKYSDVKYIVEEIYRLKLYYEAYADYIKEDIRTAKTEMDNSKSDYDTKNRNYENLLNDANSKNTALENGRTSAENAQAAYESAKAAREALEAAQAAAPATVPKGSTVRTKSSYNSEIASAKIAEASAKTEAENAAAAIPGLEESYNAAAALVPSAETAKNEAYAVYVEKKEVYDGLVQQKANADSFYGGALSNYFEFSQRYQNDLYFYSMYKNAAKSAIGDRVSKVQAQFKKITTNLESILNKLKDIDTAMVDTDKAITTYKTEVEKWKTAANKYSSDDNFKEQQLSEIEATDKTYNQKSLKLMREYMTSPDVDKSIYNKYKKLYDEILDNNNYKYGTKRIDALITGDDVVAAISDQKSSLPTIVTISDAAAKFDGLYQQPAELKLDTIQQVKFLKDKILPIQFLKYLNENYPEEKSTVKVATGSGTVEDKNAASIKSSFEAQKDELKKNSGKDTEDTQPGNVGALYSYKGKTIPTTYGGAAADKTVDTKDYKLDESGGKIDASSGISAQNSKLDSILGGVGNIAETGLENVYILSYLFENFSYNTVVQDMVAREKGFSTLAGANSALGGDLSGYVPKMLSSYPINKANNQAYGAEIEYVLYGNASADANVKYTKASIYAVRFAFNCIFAFTDSEIRNITMAAGMAVQAATLGIVPYQIVQIVLQLAVAAAESAMDLELMNKGLKVALVKSSDTWVCSVSGAVNLASDFVIQEGTKLATEAISKLAEGAQKVVDASAEELSGAITDLKEDLDDAAQQKVDEISDAIFGVIEEEMMAALDELCFTDEFEIEPGEVIADAKGQAKNSVDKIFNGSNGLSTKIENTLDDKFADNELATKVLDKIKPKIAEILSGVQAEINAKIDSVPVPEKQEQYISDIGEKLLSEMSEIKLSLISKVMNAVSGVTDELQGVANDYVSSVKGQLETKIQEAAANVSEEAAKEIKKSVTNITNDLLSSIDESGGTANLGKGADIGQPGSGSSSVASLIKFGYKDYLMLFVFIKICSEENGDSTMRRLADLIEYNVKNADSSKGASYTHIKGADFSMKNAYTYVNINAEAKLKMLFLNMDFFNSMFAGEGVSVEEQLSKGATIKYSNFYGY